MILKLQNYYSKEQKKDKISLYDLIEKKFGHISCILDVEGINTNYSFPNSAEIEQKPILNKEDMKPRYQINPNDSLKGKKIVIVGASGKGEVIWLLEWELPVMLILYWSIRKKMKKN